MTRTHTPLAAVAAAIAFLLMPVQSHAKPPRIPSVLEMSLDLPTLIKLSGSGKQLVVSHPMFDREVEKKGKKANVPTQFATAGVLVDAPLDFAKAVAYDFEKYPDFLPQVEKVVVKKQSDTRQQVEWELEVGFSVASFAMEYTWDFQILPNGAGIWRLVDGGDLDESYGAWEFLDAGNGQTLLFYTAWSDIRSSSWLIRKVMEVQPAVEQSFGAAYVTAVTDSIRKRINAMWKKQNAGK